MIKRHLDIENLKVIGNAGLRIGKTIVIEGTKTVALKAVTTTVAASLVDGFDGVKKLDLNDVLGDVTRREKKEAKKLARLKKKEERLEDLRISRESKEVGEED